MKTISFILTCLAIILALVAIATWIHPVVSVTIILGSAIGAVVAGCVQLEKEERL